MDWNTTQAPPPAPVAPLSRRRAIRLIGLTPVALGTALATAGRAGALEEAPPPMPSCVPPPMGMVGIVRGQVLGVGLFHHGEIPCSLNVAVVGIDGKALATEKVTLPAGGGIYRRYELLSPRDPALPREAARRLMFHVMVEGAEPPPSPDHLLGASAELLDAKTGRAAGAMNPCQLPVSSPALAMGMVAVGARQTVRVGLFHHELIPCSTIVDVRGVDGKVLASQATTLPPGGGGFVDFPLGQGLAPGGLLAVHVDVRHSPNHVVSASLELFGRDGVGHIPDSPCGMPDPNLGP